MGSWLRRGGGELESQTDKTVVITGASDGIGEAAARSLARAGACVVLVGRSPAKTANVAADLGCAYYLADFTKFDDVRRLARQLQTDLPHIDVLANNAGGIMGAPQLTADGNEMTLQVNHLAPFLLTNLLLDVLIASHATVVTTSSIANRHAGTLDLADINLEEGYSSPRAYRRTKLMNILFTKELHKRYNNMGIAAAAFHPGIVRTSFATEFPGPWSFAYTSVMRHLYRSPAKGADTLVWLAASQPGQQWQSGEYYKNRRISRASRQAYDPRLAEDLWDLSLKLTNLG
jgi:NAD(P)-dependent dehydrogenase (short-subunit alcohol dehydrogenase family)